MAYILWVIFCSDGNEGAQDNINNVAIKSKNLFRNWNTCKNCTKFNPILYPDSSNYVI